MKHIFAIKKMKKICVVMSLLMTVPVLLMGQEPFACLRTGTVMEYKGIFEKTDSVFYVQKKILGVTGDGLNCSIESLSTSMDQNQVVIDSLIWAAVIKDGALIIDHAEKMKKSMLKTLGNLPKEEIPEIKTSGEGPLLPKMLTVGEHLASSEQSVSVLIMNTSILVSDREVSSLETIRTPAGEFECYKINESVTTASMGRSGKKFITSWYSRGIGMVKEETYDSQHRLMVTLTLNKLITGDNIAF